MDPEISIIFPKIKLLVIKTFSNQKRTYNDPSYNLLTWINDYEKETEAYIIQYEVLCLRFQNVKKDLEKYNAIEKNQLFDYTFNKFLKIKIKKNGGHSYNEYYKEMEKVLCDYKSDYYSNTESFELYFFIDSLKDENEKYNKYKKISFIKMSNNREKIINKFYQGIGIILIKEKTCNDVGNLISSFL